jgi:hypothetical protein
LRRFAPLFCAKVEHIVENHLNVDWPLWWNMLPCIRLQT